MIDAYGKHTLKFKKYRLRSFNPSIPGLRIVENSVIVKLAEYIESDIFDVVSLTTDLAVKEPSQVDVTDAKQLKTSRFIQVAMDAKHQKDYYQFIGVLDGEELKQDGSNAFLLRSDAMWKLENEQLADKYLMPAEEDNFIGTLTPLTNFINDTINCKIVIKEYKGEFFPDGDITMFLNTPEYSFLQKITGKTINEEGEVDFKQATHAFKDDQNVSQFKVVPLGFQGDKKINLYMPGMDSRRILDKHDLVVLQTNVGNDMLAKGVADRTALAFDDAEVIRLLDTYQYCVRTTQAFVNDFQGFRITQAEYNGGTADQKAQHHVGDIRPGDSIGTIKALTLADQKGIAQANDRHIDLGKMNHPDGQEKESTDGRLGVCLEKILTAASTYCVTRFSVEADMTEKHRYYLPYYFTVSLPAQPDSSFVYKVAHKIKSAGFEEFVDPGLPGVTPGTPAYENLVKVGRQYGEKKLKLSTPYVAHLEDTEIEPILPEELVEENLNKIAGSLSKGTNDYMKYIVHIPNDSNSSLGKADTGLLSINNPDLGVATNKKKTLSKSIPNTKGYGGAFQPIRSRGAGAGGHLSGGRPKLDEGVTYIMPNKGGNIHSNSLQLSDIDIDSRHDKDHMALIIEDNELYKPNQVGGEFKPKLSAGDIVIDTDPFRMDIARTAAGVNTHLVANAPKMFYNKADLERQIIKDHFGGVKPSGFTLVATPEIVSAPQQWQKVDRLYGSYPFDDIAIDVDVYRGRDIKVTGEIDQKASTNILLDAPVVFDKLQGRDRKRLLTGASKGLDIELASTRTNTNFRDLSELYITGVGLDNISIDFSFPNFFGINTETLSFDFETEVKYDETKSSVRIIF